VKLKQGCSIYSDYGLNVSADEYTDYGVPIIRTSDVDNYGLLDLHNTKYVNPLIVRGKTIQKGDILFSRSGTIGRAMVFDADVDATYAAYLVRFRPHPQRLLSQFVGYWAQSADYWHQIAADTIQSTIGNFNANKFANLSIPDLDLPTQRAIADFLDRETARIDALIDKKQRLVELSKLKKDIQLEVVLFESDFPIRKLRREAQTISKGTTPSTIGAEMVTDGIRFLKAENVTWDGVMASPENYISHQTHKILRRSALESNDVLVVIAGATTGKTAVLHADLTPANTNQAVSFVRLINPLYAEVVCAAIGCSRIQRDIHLASVQSAQPNLSMENLGNLMLPFPDVGTLSKILSHVDATKSRIANLVSSIEVSIDRLKEYRSALITAAVTGQIDVTAHNRSGTTKRHIDTIEENASA